MYINFMKSGDDTIKKEELSKIYTLYSSKVYNLAFKISGDKQTAEDITHETFLKILENYNSFRAESKIYTWIFTIAKNTSLRYIENKKRTSFKRIENLIEIENIPEKFDLYSKLEKQYYINEVKNGCLIGVLRSLSFSQRIAFIFYVFYELTINEIADILKKSNNSIRILISRARSNLKNFLCNNCSLYSHENNCKCENLISFSLRQGWIEKYNPSLAINQIETEIKELKNVINLYKTIPQKEINDNLRSGILTVIRNHNYKILSEKKVK